MSEIDFQEHDAEVVEDKVEVVDAVPTMTDPGWNEYVMSHFTPDELWEGKPVVHGLRRVTELLVGEIVDIDPQVPQTPDLNNERRATAIVKVTIVGSDGQVRVYGGAADAYEGNTEYKFAKSPVAIADTRAEVRALRRALRLKTVAAEELVSGDASQSEDTDKDVSIQPNQISMINMMALRGNINVKKLVDSLVKSEKIGNNSISKLTQAEGSVLCQAVSALQSGEGAEELKGYDENWRN